MVCCGWDRGFQGCSKAGWCCLGRWRWAMKVHHCRCQATEVTQRRMVLEEGLGTFLEAISTSELGSIVEHVLAEVREALPNRLDDLPRRGLFAGAAGDGHVGEGDVAAWWFSAIQRPKAHTTIAAHVELFILVGSLYFVDDGVLCLLLDAIILWYGLSMTVESWGRSQCN
ncbi:hypothetical protein CAPTEDRAFT_211994 [Capitella teleta]|uniref:Uncharacterized protein n=1 Tax=Capitella teleta TaxID=283909 RepID=R7U5J0_CAPTE|nr:hypothetical protein CAPTEDRAFT_211994 [Capitella teleta]|eukprot:ELU01371.1 hypothetical protein CAPTEDRAFT_211994 [Capitella teleta]